MIVVGGEGGEDVVKRRHPNLAGGPSRQVR
jgi:hypothetical protein